MKKMHIILVATAGLLSFAASFGVSWYKKQKNAAQAAVPPTATAPVAQTAAAPSGLDLSGVALSDKSDESLGLTERQLQNLIYDIREKMKDYNARQKTLDDESARIDVARQSLHTDIEQLNALREKLDMTLAALNEKEDSLKKSVLEIEQMEKSNFQRLAATYEKMDAAQAGKIMLSMAAGNQVQDVVKILYYMNDRNAGKLLGEIGSTRPEVAGILSLQLKRVKESG